MGQLTQNRTHYFRLEQSSDEEWYILFAIVPNNSNLRPRAKFAADMGKDMALKASWAIANSFGYCLVDETED